MRKSFRNVERFRFHGCCPGSTPPWAHPPQTCALAGCRSELCRVLVTFEDGVPLAVRVLPWGGENITDAIADQLGISRDDAEKLKTGLAQDPSVEGGLGPRIQAAIDAALGSLAGAINGYWTGQKIYLSGRSAQLKDFSRPIGAAIERRHTMRAAEFHPRRRAVRAVLGLRTATSEWQRLYFGTPQSKPTNGSAGLARPAPWKWAALALGLAIFSTGSAVLGKRPCSSGGSQKAEGDPSRPRPAGSDRPRPGFSPAPEAKPTALPGCALPGGKSGAAVERSFDSLTMNRRGDLALRGSMKTGSKSSVFGRSLSTPGSSQASPRGTDPHAGPPEGDGADRRAVGSPVTTDITLPLGDDRRKLRKLKTVPRMPSRRISTYGLWAPGRHADDAVHAGRRIWNCCSFPKRLDDKLSMHMPAEERQSG